LAESLPKQFVFHSNKDKAELKIPLEDISPDFPRNWMGYEALVLEVKASSPQRMHLKIYTSDSSFSRVLFHPYQNVALRAAIPIGMLTEPPKTGVDMAAVGNRSRPGYFLSLWGPFVPLTDVKAIAFQMDHPVDSPTLEVRSIKLAKESPGDAVLENLPLVDEFGQFKYDTWPGKTYSLDKLEQAWRAEEQELAAGDFGYCEYGGYEESQAKGTGFFRVERIDGKWWFVDPDGHLFLSAGSDVMRSEMVTRTEGRKEFFAALPPADLTSGYRRYGFRGASFLTWNLYRRFGEDWKTKWIAMTIRRMESWGLNTIANWSDWELAKTQKKPYAIPLRSWQTEVGYLGLPDVYSEEFEKLVDERAKAQCESLKDDPWLLGYFLANEPPFTQKELQTADLILSGPDTATKRELKKWLVAVDSEERRKEFIDQAFDRYVQLTSAAVKKYDPNHLNLGMRGGGRPTKAEIRAARAFDVYSVNIYNYEVSAERAKTISELTGKPIVIGEFHFGTPGRGLAASLVQVADQKQRGIAYRYYVEQAFSIPGLIGTHYFQWADQPTTGRYDGEDYNIGLIDVTDRAYPEMVKALQETHKRLYQVHSGELKPFAKKAKVN
jgi:hypothetical protein